MSVNSRQSKFQKDILIFSEELKTKLFKLMRQVSKDIDKSLKESISLSGETVNGKRLASLPYEPPYKVSGNLIASSGAIYEEEPSRAVIKVGTDISAAPYAVYLEYGSARMFPRPYILPCATAYFNKICTVLPSLKESL